MVAMPTEMGRPASSRTRRRIERAMWTGSPKRRMAPATSRKASSIEIGSTRGVKCSNTAMTALLASTYASNRAGTVTRSGQRRRASAPDMAERIPNRRAS